MDLKPPRPFYHEFGWAYDLLQTEAVAPRVDFIEAMLSRSGIGPGAQVLDAGCGTGRYAVELARRGFRVFGADRSSELVAVAQSREAADTVKPSFVIANLLDLSFARPFDAVLCRGVLNDILDDNGRRTIFRQFASWLSPGGILIFDVREWTLTRARYTREPLHRRAVELPDGILRFESETILDEQSRRLLIHERFEVIRDGVPSLRENDFAMRAWTLEEVSACLESEGLEEISTHPSYGESDRSWSDRIVVIATSVTPRTPARPPIR